MSQNAIYPDLSQFGTDSQNWSVIETTVDTKQSQALVDMVEKEEKGGCLGEWDGDSSRPFCQALCIDNAARLYFISPEGSVCVSADASNLEIFVFTDDVGAGAPSAFIKVDEWTFPLIKGCSPVLLHHTNHYIFPDLEQADHYIGVVVDAARKSQCCQLKHLLQEHAALVTSQQSPTSAASVRSLAQDSTTASQIADTLVKGADVVSRGVSAGAVKLSQYMNRATCHFIGRTDDASINNTGVTVDPRVQSSLSTAQHISAGAVEVSERVVSAVGHGTMCLAHFLAPYVKSGGTRLLHASGVVGDNKEQADKTMDGVLEVAGGAVRGMGVLYCSLARAGQQLASSMSSNTVQLVAHRYGGAAAAATAAGLEAAGNILLTGHNVQALGGKALAKRVVKDTGKQLLSTHTDIQ